MHFRNLIPGPGRGKVETITLAQNLVQLAQYQAGDTEFAIPLELGYEILSPPTVPGAGAPQQGTGVVFYLEWGHNHVTERRSFFAGLVPQLPAASYNKVPSAPFHGRFSVMGTFARLSAAVGTVIATPITTTTQVAGWAGPSVAGPAEQTNRLTAWGVKDQTDDGATNLVLLPIGASAVDPNNSFTFLVTAPAVAAPIKLARISGYNYGTTAAFGMLFDQVGAANPNAIAPRFCVGNIPPGAIFSVDMQLSGLGFTTGAVFVPSATGDKFTAPAAGANFHIDYEQFIV